MTSVPSRATARAPSSTWPRWSRCLRPVANGTWGVSSSGAGKLGSLTSLAKTVCYADSYICLLIPRIGVCFSVRQLCVQETKTPLTFFEQFLTRLNDRCLRHFLLRKTVRIPDTLSACTGTSQLFVPLLLTGVFLRGAYVNLDGGFDSRANRTCIFNAGMIPNIKENPRNRKTTKRGRKRFPNAAIHALRMRVERTFAWEDKSSGCCYDLNADPSSDTMG